MWRAAGHLLGNHTYSHPNLNDLSISDFKKEIDRNETLLKKLSGKTDWKYFRYPFLCEGATLEKRNGIRAYLNQKGYKWQKSQNLLVKL